MKLRKIENETMSDEYRYFEDGPINEHNFTQGYAEHCIIRAHVSVSRMYWVNQENVGFVLRLNKKYYHI